MKNIFDLDDFFITIFLCIVVPFVFLWGANVHMYNVLFLLICFLTVLIGAAVFSYVIIFFAKKKLIIKLNGFISYYEIFCASLSGFMLALLLSVPLRVNTYVSFYFFLIVAAFTSFFVLLSLAKKIKVINVLLLVWLFISGGSLVLGVLFADDHVVDKIDTKVVFKDSPNVYLVLLESYHDIETLLDVYSIDVSSFTAFMQNYKFYNYDNVYSPYFATLPTLGSIFSMRPVRELIKNSSDVARPVRDIIGGSSDNFVARTFKNNGYFTGSIYFATDYYILHQGPYLDKIDVDLKKFGLHTFGPIFDVNIHSGLIYSVLRKNLRISQISNKLNPIDSLDQILKYKNNPSQPHFVTIMLGARHVPLNHNFKNAENWISSDIYQDAFFKDQERLLPFLEHLVETDPNAVIVLLGDHGAGRYKEIFPKFSKDVTQYDLDLAMAQSGVSKKHIADDFFGVLCAIRIPGHEDISYGYPVSHQNIFWHVFAALCDDKDLLHHRTVSYSVIDDYYLVKDGLVLSDNIVLNQ